MAGNYQKRGDSYRLRYTYKGKTYSKTIKLKNNQKIEIMLDRFVQEVQRNSSNSSSIDFLSFARLWYSDYVAVNLRERTKQGYKELLK